MCGHLPVTRWLVGFEHRSSGGGRHLCRLRRLLPQRRLLLRRRCGRHRRALVGATHLRLRPPELPTLYNDLSGWAYEFTARFRLQRRRLPTFGLGVGEEGGQARARHACLGKLPKSQRVEHQWEPAHTAHTVHTDTVHTMTHRHRAHHGPQTPCTPWPTDTRAHHRHRRPNSGRAEHTCT